MQSPTIGSFALVLHAHQPFVLGYHRRPYGIDWLCEAVVECYLPLLRTLQVLAAGGGDPQLTLSVSPILCEQLASPLLQKELQVFFDTRLRACADAYTHFRDTNQPDMAALTEYWTRFYHETLDTLHRIDGDLLGAFRQLMEAGHLDVITSAATHGYIPLLGSEESVRFQFRLAMLTHETHFGCRPRGVWLPECAYRPRYHWIPPVGSNRQQRRALRRGIEEHVAACGLEFFFVDSQFAVGERPLSPYDDYFPQLASLRDVGRTEWPQRTGMSPYQTYRVASRVGGGTVAVFIRDPESSRQVWSRVQGYPGNPWYLEFYKKHIPGGLNLWRVSENPDVTAVYEPARGQEQAREHARHFATEMARVLRTHQSDQNARGLICALYDVELLGHWWHEGPLWLRFLYPELLQQGVAAVRCSTALDLHAPGITTTIPEGSWGEGGDHRTWLNNETAWVWERLYDCEGEFWTMVRDNPTAGKSLLGRVLCQAARELLLMQASDWPFLMTTQTARDYAEQRFLGHYTDLKRLLQMGRQVSERGDLDQHDAGYLTDTEQRDWVFPLLERALFR